eukprot:4529311-Lingulodinium_polyedra.AAC.1
MCPAGLHPYPPGFRAMPLLQASAGLASCTLVPAGQQFGWHLPAWTPAHVPGSCRVSPSSAMQPHAVPHRTAPHH